MSGERHSNDVNPRRESEGDTSIVGPGQRDRAAWHRDIGAEKRDEEAARRDLQDDFRDRMMRDSPGSQERELARITRANSESDREAAAGDRERAAHDREASRFERRGQPGAE